MATFCEEFKTRREEAEALREEFVSALREVEENNSPEARNRRTALLNTLEEKLTALKKEFAEYFDPFVDILPHPERTAERLEKLKQTNFWDEESGLWICKIDRSGCGESTDCFTKDQLLYLRLLIALGKEDEAKAHLAKLKQTKLWNAEIGLWVSSMRKDGRELESRCFTKDQLSYLRLLTAWGEREEAKAYLEKLKQTDLWDGEEGLWWDTVHSDAASNYYSIKNQLSYLRLLISLEKEDEAKIGIVRLKQTNLWDVENGLWAQCMDKRGRVARPSHYAGDQLSYLRLLIDLGEDEEARTQLERLKRTNFWDEGDGLCIHSIDAKRVARYHTGDQLSYLRLLAALGEEDEAKVFLEKLKQTNLWDKQWEEWWISSIHSDPMGMSVRSIEDQLLGALVEGLVE